MLGQAPEQVPGRALEREQARVLAPEQGLAPGRVLVLEQELAPGRVLVLEPGQGQVLVLEQHRLPPVRLSARLQQL